MVKIYVTGSTGSGKTTVALELSRQFSAPAFMMDEIVWDNSKGFTGKRYSDEARDAKIAKMLGMQSWVAEGIYFDEWMLPVLHAVDFVLILTPPTFVRDYRLVKRCVQSRFQVGRRKEGLALLYKNIKWGHAFERNKMPGLVDLLDREGIKYYRYSRNNAIDYVFEELV
jgi:adenylate kinase family enzyme